MRTGVQLSETTSRAMAEDQFNPSAHSFAITDAHHSADLFAGASGGLISEGILGGGDAEDAESTDADIEAATPISRRRASSVTPGNLRIPNFDDDDE